jgi:2-amino-4-hydroxy-6-hydroxymethyldihydropteridine diphosphokinase
MIVLALGANLPSDIGPPVATLRAALTELERAGIAPLAVSKFYATPAWPDPRDPAFVNAVARVETKLPPSALLEELHRVERHFGRTRDARNAPRTLDLDIIDYDGRVEEGPPHLPHPRASERGFVLMPLADIAPEWSHPVTGKSLEALIAALPASQRDMRELAPGG